LNIFSFLLVFLFASSDFLSSSKINLI
jgi:hypothetical protein